MPWGSLRTGAAIVAVIFGRERIVEIDDDERFVGEDVGVGAGDRDAAGAGEGAAGIESQGALQEIVGGVAVEERADAGTFGFQVGIADDDQAFFVSAT